MGFQGFFFFCLPFKKPKRSTTGQQKPDFRMCRKEIMASIKVNKKDGKIVSFKFRVFIGRDEYGRQRFKTKTWKPDKDYSEKRLLKLAENEATLWEHEIVQGVGSLPKGKRKMPSYIKFSDFVNNEWLPSLLNDECRVTTYEFRVYLLQTMLPYFGDILLSDIDARKASEYLDYLKYERKNTRGKPLSPQTRKHHYSILNLIFKYAIQKGYISENPMELVTSPKLKRHRVDAFSKSETELFVKAVDELPLMQCTIYYILLTTGVRRGECFGLKWGDIDFKNGLMKINRSVSYTTKSGAIVGEPKTENGYRTIPIAVKTLELLEEYRQAETPVKNDYFLFHSEESKAEPRDPSYITKHMKKLMIRCELPNMSPHDLRHTCASLLLQDGADIKSVQDILGHADARTTLNFYARSDLAQMRASINNTFNY